MGAAADLKEADRSGGGGEVGGKDTSEASAGDNIPAQLAEPSPAPSRHLPQHLLKMGTVPLLSRCFCRQAPIVMFY